MPDDIRITINELRRRMEAGEDFAFIDTRNPQTWAQSDVMIRGALRVPLDNFEEHIYETPEKRATVTYCT